MSAGLNGSRPTAWPPFDPTDPDDPAHLRLLYGVPAGVPDDRVREYVRLARQESEAGRAYETALLRLRGRAAALGAWVPSPTVDRATLAAPPGSGTGGAVSIGSLGEPPPRRWTVAGLVPEGAPSILAGHSGLGKSYVALLLSICVCTGRPFLGRDTRRASVLWVDRELDQDEMARRSFAVARGLGLGRPPDTLYYLRPNEPIGNETTQRLVLDAVERYGIGLTVLDSLTVGALGDAKEQRDVVAVMRHVEAWGTSLSIDHITKSAAAGNHSSATIFGSGMKRAVARSTFFLAPAGDALALRPDKSNFGAASSPVYLRASHLANERGRAEVTFETLDTADGALRGAEDHAPAHEQTLFAILRLFESGGGPVALATLAAEREAKESTIRNHISKLGGRVVKHGDNTYSPSGSRSGAPGSEAETEPRVEDHGGSNRESLRDVRPPAPNTLLRTPPSGPDRRGK